MGNTYMSKKYCQKCNNPTEYNDTLPAFCAFCGNPFAGTTASKIVSEVPKTFKRPVKRIEAEEVEEDDEETIFEEKPDFGKLELELDIPQRPTIEAKALIFDKSQKENIIRPKLRKMNKNQVAEDFKRELRSVKESKESSELKIRDNSGD
jgi:hypothetical protein